MRATKAMRQIIEDAAEAGYKVSEKEYQVDLEKGDYGIRIWEDGTANRLDVDASVALTIRTQKEIRKALKI